MKRIDLDQQRIAAFCQRWKLKEFSLFGSALGPEFGPDSDVDVLVSFESDARPTLLDLAAMRDELMELFGREVDLLTRAGLDHGENHLRRISILENLRVIYAA